MRLSEIITIYLAAGAPFGVNHFLQERRFKNGAQVFLESTWMVLLWPLVATANLLGFKRATHQDTETSEIPIAQQTEIKVARAKGKLLAALYQIDELARAPLSSESQNLERAVCVVSDVVEKYVGLTMAAAEIASDESPSPRETELCRIAGRAGDDLLLAGRCLRRRNAARLVAHQARARTELLQVFAEMRDLVDRTRPASLVNLVAARHLSVATLKFYGYAIDLLSLLEDESAATSVARLLDAECARLRCLESYDLNDTHERTAGEQECTTPPTPPPSTTRPLQGTTLTQG